MTTLYTDGKTAQDKKKLYNGGDIPRVVKADTLFLTTHAADDVLLLVPNIPVDTLVKDIVVTKTIASISGASDLDFGFYAPNRTSTTDPIGTVLDADALVDGEDWSSGQAVGSILGENVSGFDFTKTIGELLDLTVEDQPAGVHLCLTMNSEVAAEVQTYLDIQLVNAG